MLGYILKRLLLAVPTLFAVLTIVFVLARVLPGDPAQTILGDQASAEALAAMRARLGVDKPIGVQYVDFLLNAVRGEWGNSLVTGKPVVEEVLNVLPYTIDLTVSAIVLGTLAGIPLGVWSALRRNTWVDYVARIGSLLGLSFPGFVSAILLLLVFAIQLRWFPVISAGSLDDPVERLRNLALPALNLAIIMAAYVTRVTRSSMLEVLGEDYIRTARAKGVPTRAVIWRHAFRNGLMPVVTVVGLYLGILIGNSVLTEIVFNRPGLGKLIVSALNQRDYTVLQGMMVVYAFAIVLVNLLTDLTYGFIDNGPVGDAYRTGGVADGLGLVEGNLEQNVDRLAKAPLVSQPGADWHYSLSTDVLGRVVEVASGMPLDRFFKERIFGPLKMNDTGFDVADAKWPRLATVYTPDGAGGVRPMRSPESFGNTHFAPDNFKVGKAYF